MALNSLIERKQSEIEVDIFADRSAMVLFTLLSTKKSEFSVNELARESTISIGLAHKVISYLEYIGIVKSHGLRTGKTFVFANREKVLLNWIQSYSLVKKTKRKGFSLDANAVTLKKYSNLLLPALHTASKELFHAKITNLNVKEYYLIDWDQMPTLLEKTNIVEMDRGYELLLVKPYYKALVNRVKNNPEEKKILISYELLTFLDLLHFPVRGFEQAEVLYKKSDYLKSLCPWSKIENAVG